jgi:hypothetical protein
VFGAMSTSGGTIAMHTLYYDRLAPLLVQVCVLASIDRFVFLASPRFELGSSARCCLLSEIVARSDSCRGCVLRRATCIAVHSIALSQPSALLGLAPLPVLPSLS